MSTIPVAFTIPSLCKETELHCRVYHPSRENATRPGRGAIIAHPYASLGGSYDDHAVLTAVHALVEKGFIVSTFNFRGAKPSGGSTSWSGKPEIEDYTSVVGFLLHYVNFLSLGDDAPGVQAAVNAIPDTAPPSHSESQHDLPASRPVTLILGGYSYGALTLSYLPPISDIIARFSDPSTSLTEFKIIRQASNLAGRTKTTGSELTGSLDAPTSRALRISVVADYLFISPVLGMIRRLLHWTPITDDFWVNRVLVVTGDQDSLASEKSAAKWVAGRGADFKVVKGTGHFWLEETARLELIDIIGAWVSRLDKK